MGAIKWRDKDGGILVDQLAKLDGEADVLGLLGNMSGQIGAIDEPLSYYEGTYPLPEVSPEASRVYHMYKNLSRRPWGRLIVDALSERLDVSKVKVTSEAQGFDVDAFWKRSHMRASQGIAHREQVAAGLVYFLVWPDANDQPIATVESAKQMSLLKDVNGRPYMAAKLSEEFGKPRLDVWTAQAWSVYEIKERKTENDQWVLVSEEENKAGMMPVVAMPYRPTLRHPEGRSELIDLIPALRSVDRITMEMHLAAHVAAYPQRWVAGVKADPNDPNPWKQAIDGVFMSDDHDTKFGNFESVDTKQYVTLIDAEIANLAALSRVPSQYLLSVSLANPPSEGSIKGQEGPLIAKLSEVQEANTDVYQKIVRVAAAFSGVANANELDVQVMWSPLSTDSLAQQADAMTKWASVDENIPIEWMMRQVGVDEEVIEQFNNQRMAQTLLNDDGPSDPAIAAALQIVTNQPTILDSMIFADLVAQLRNGGVE